MQIKSKDEAIKKNMDHFMEEMNQVKVELEGEKMINNNATEYKQLSPRLCESIYSTMRMMAKTCGYTKNQTVRVAGFASAIADGGAGPLTLRLNQVLQHAQRGEVFR